jgi:hypothetical protein
MSSQHVQSIPRDSLDQAILLNNQGMSYALADNDEQAVYCFSKALTIFKTLVFQEDDEDALHSSAILHEGTHQLPQFQESNFFLFNGIISFTRCDESCSSPADNHIYCAGIILNIALLYHRQAILGQNPEAMIKAQHFYDIVTKVVSSQSENQSTGLMVKLAAINNLSQIRLEQGDVDTAEEGFQTLAWLVSCTELEHSVLFSTQELEGMLLNVLMSDRQRVAPAA